MRCIFCKQASDHSRSVEHILPESLGNQNHTLPPGIVCDGCNNYFSTKLEKPILESGHFRTLRFQEMIPSKKGRIPVQKAILGLGTAGMLATEVEREENGAIVIRIPPEHWDTVANIGVGKLLIPAEGQHPPERLMSRLLAKISLEAMVHRVLADHDLVNYFVNESQLDPLRKWARYGMSDTYWPFSQRVIYDVGHMHVDASEEPFQCLHEFDFLFTDPGEVYFCLAIFGIEYTINMGGPELEGFSDWLLKHNHASPLYTPKRSRRNSEP